MSKAAGKLNRMKKAVEKIKHGTLRTNIPAGMAAAGPPLGPMLGQVIINISFILLFYLLLCFQRGLNIAAFCKDFNEKTSEIKEGIPLPCRVFINPDRSYEMIINKPPTVYFLKQAAGIDRAAMDAGIMSIFLNLFLYRVLKTKD